MQPRVSIVMPVYNGEKFVRNAINSILNQTFKDWELIIIDDGSIDMTSFVIKKFDDPRITYFYQPHSGIVVSRNYGNSLARGEYIAMQDCDDLSMPDRLEKSLAEIGDNDVLYHGIYLNFWNVKYGCIEREYRPALPLEVDKLVQQQYIPGVCMFKKSLWEKKPFRLETQHSFDWMMHLDWSLSGAKYKALDIGLYEYVRQQGSASDTYEKDGLREQSFKNIKEILKKEYGR